MPKISREGGPSVAGSHEHVDLNTVVTLGMLSKILDYLHLGVYIEGPRNVPLGSDESAINMTGKGIWLGFHGYQ